MFRYKPLAYVAAAAALAAPPMLVAADVALLLRISTAGLVLERSALALFVPAIAGAAVAAHDRARWQVSMGAGLAAIGAAAMALMPGTLIAPTRMPAVLFPLGLLVLASAMIGSAVPRRTAALIGAGALLFPLGHLSGVPAAVIGADVVLLAAFWQLASRIKNLTNPV